MSEQNKNKNKQRKRTQTREETHMQKTGETEIQLQRASLNASRNMYASEVFGVNKQASVCNFHMRPMTLSVYVSLNLKYKKIPLFIDAIANLCGHV